MFRSKACHFFMRLIPIKAWKGFLLRRHIDYCPACKEKLAGPNEVRTVLRQPEETGDLEGFWQFVEARLKQKEMAVASAEPYASGGWRWKRAAAAGIFILFILGGYLVFRDTSSISPGPEPGAGKKGDRFSLSHLKIGDESANPIIYKPFGSDFIFIWAEKHEK